MGLDISAYRNLRAVRPLTQEEIEDGDEPEGFVTLRHFNSDFPKHQEDLPKDTVFTCEDKMGF